MSRFTIRKALPTDGGRIHELVDCYAKKGEMLPLPLGDVYERIRDFSVAVEDGRVVGCCALRVSWDNLAEIRSLAVDSNYTRKGIGSKLVKSCVKEAEDFGIPRVFTLTNKPDYFKKLGFTKVSKEELPMKIWGECVHCNKYTCCDEEALVYKVE